MWGKQERKVLGTQESKGRPGCPAEGNPTTTALPLSDISAAISEPSNLDPANLPHYRAYLLRLPGTVPTYTSARLQRPQLRQIIPATYGLPSLSCIPMWYRLHHISSPTALISTPLMFPASQTSR